MTSTRTLSTLTLVGEHLKDDESSFEVAVFKGPAEPLGVLLEGAAEPLDAILWGLAEPLSVSEEHLADSHGTRALADTVLDFPEEARVPVDTYPGPPEEHTLDSPVPSRKLIVVILHFEVMITNIVYILREAQRILVKLWRFV